MVMAKEKSSSRPIRAMFPDIQHLMSEDIKSSDILKQLLKDEVPKSIKKAHKEKKTYACVFEINNSNHYLEIHKKDWIDSLNSCIVFNVELEEYDKCTEITQLIEEIKSTKSSPKIKLP
jgi:hypothetical protein